VKCKNTITIKMWIFVEFFLTAWALRNVNVENVLVIEGNGIRNNLD